MRDNSRRGTLKRRGRKDKKNFANEIFFLSPTRRGKTWTVLYKPQEPEAFSSQRSLSVAIIGTTQGRGKYNAACYVTFRK